ncbi:unnamed protein product [Blepharisma stoltei]|uniref:Uncharacterized protein n=1 Tax=Blepharisma stoltei TaxID=1481888 RepID=A0AAU9J0N5_9CILI|nr:unnamed protein product [Blepharisma stoltei]
MKKRIGKLKRRSQKLYWFGLDSERKHVHNFIVANSFKNSWALVDFSCRYHRGVLKAGTKNEKFSFT